MGRRSVTHDTPSKRQPARVVKPKKGKVDPSENGRARSPRVAGRVPSFTYFTPQGRGRKPEKPRDTRAAPLAYYTPPAPCAVVPYPPTDAQVLDWFAQQEPDYRAMLAHHIEEGGWTRGLAAYLRALWAMPCTCGFGGTPREFHRFDSRRCSPLSAECVAARREDNPDDLPF